MPTEVELLFHRLTAGGDPKHALGSARAMRDGLAEAHGRRRPRRARTPVLDGADQPRRGGGHRGSAPRATPSAPPPSPARRSWPPRPSTLAAEATQWKQAGDRFKAILDEWRTIRGIDRKTDEQLWKRFSKAREAFNRRRGSHFADLDRQRAGAKHRKEELAEEAEKLADSDDWGPTAARFRDLMAEWKAAGRAHKDADDALWQRFRTAQDAFFARRSAARSPSATPSSSRTPRPSGRCSTRPRRSTPSDPDAARAALRAVQERWEEIGKVPRDDIRPLEARLRADRGEGPRGRRPAVAAHRPGGRGAGGAVPRARRAVRGPGGEGPRRGRRQAGRSRPRPRPPSGGSGSAPRSRPSSTADTPSDTRTASPAVWVSRQPRRPAIRAQQAVSTITATTASTIPIPGPRAAGEHAGLPRPDRPQPVDDGDPAADGA